MSKDWGYRCTKDGEASDTWFNHGENILRSCVKCWPLIKQIGDLDETGYIEVTLLAHDGAASEVWSFLSEHYEHGVELLDEYGHTEPLEVPVDEQTT